MTMSSTEEVTRVENYFKGNNENHLPPKEKMAMRYIRRLSTEVLPYHLRSISERLRQKAAEELCETDETREIAIEELREKVQNEPQLQCPVDDDYLVQFLRARKFDVDQAFTLLKNFYEVRRKHKELYKDMNFQGIRKVIKTNFFGFLPFRDKEDCVVLLMHAGRWNPSEVNIKDIMRALTAGLIQAIDDPATQITGFKVIVDFKGFSMKHIRHMEPTYLYMMAGAMQSCFPGRFRAVHIVNENFLFKYIWSILKVILVEKLKKRFVFHGSKVEELKEYFPRTLLPKTYGGNLNDFDNKAWVEKMEEFEEMIMKSMRYGYHRKESCIPEM